MTDIQDQNWKTKTSSLKKFLLSNKFGPLENEKEVIN